MWAARSPQRGSSEMLAGNGPELGQALGPEIGVPATIRADSTRCVAAAQIRALRACFRKTESNDPRCGLLAGDLRARERGAAATSWEHVCRHSHGWWGHTLLAEGPAGRKHDPGTCINDRRSVTLGAALVIVLCSEAGMECPAQSMP